MDNISFYKKHFKVILIDYLQKNCMPLLAIACLFLHFINMNKISAIKWLMKSHRTYAFKLTERIVIKNLEFIRKNAKLLFDGADDAGEAIQKKRGIVLKNPVISEAGACIKKGVYLITFTGTFQFYIEKIDVQEIQKKFHIILEPSWAGYCLSEILWWTKLDHPIIVQATEITDYNFIKNLKSNLIPSHFGASDWVNHDVFYPITPAPPKIFDSIYVSNHKTIKRNHVYLKAISKINEPNYKAALVCSGWGDNREYNLELLKRLKLDNKLTLIEKLPQIELNKVLNQAKVNILLSLKEGSNRSLFEGFFSGTPGILLKDNIGVNKSYFTKESGSIIAEKDLVKTLVWYTTNFASFTPRKWAEQNISIFKTQEKLDTLIKELDNNLIPATTTALKINSPEANYYLKQDEQELLSNKEFLNKFSLNN